VGGKGFLLRQVPHDGWKTNLTLMQVGMETTSNKGLLPYPRKALGLFSAKKSLKTAISIVKCKRN